MKYIKWKKWMEMYARKEMTREQIANEIGIEKIRVSWAIKSYGLKVWDGKEAKYKAIMEKIRPIYKPGMKAREVADLIGEKYGEVWWTMKRNGLIKIRSDRRKRKGKRVVVKTKVRKMNYDYPGKYHDPFKDKSPLGILFYTFNRDMYDPNYKKAVRR